MPRETLQTFLIRHRFQPWEIVPSVNGISREDFALLHLFPGEAVFFGRLFNEELLELRKSLSLAEYMASNATDQPEQFAQIVSAVGNEGWAFALKFARYHKVHLALENLKLVQSALLEAHLSLNAAKAGMESAMLFPQLETRSYEREVSKATINLLNFSSLYASYVDICRRLRKYVGLDGRHAYDRAIEKIIGSSTGKHRFIKDLRNFILHHQLLRPSMTITHAGSRTATLHLHAHSLIVDGYDWKNASLGFIQSNPEIDIIATTENISKDVARLIAFHVKMVERHLRQDKLAYEFYNYERSKTEHLSRSVSNVEAIFNQRRKSLVSKTVDKSLLRCLMNSSLVDDEVRQVISLVSDRHKNFTPEMKASIDKEITALLSSRPRFPLTRVYLGGRSFPRNSRHPSTVGSEESEDPKP